MALRLSRGFRLNLINSHYRIFGLSSVKNFHSAYRILEKHNNRPHLNRVEKEILKLKELKEEYNNAGFLEKFRIRAKLLEQELKITQAQSLQTIESSIPIPEVSFKDDPLNLDNIKRYEVIYRFMLNSFINECESYTKLGPNNENPDKLIEDILESFKDIHKDVQPIEKEDVLFYFNVFYSLLNNVIFMDELKFNNDVVSSLLQKYTTLEPTELTTEKASEISKEIGVDSKVTEGWFNIFGILASTPFADVNSKFTCSICPYEYARYKSFSKEVDAVQEKVSKIYGNFPKNPMPSPFGNYNFKNSNSDKNDSKSNDKKEKDKKNIDLEINLNSAPMRFFQAVLIGILFYFIFNLSQEDSREITFQEFSSQFLSKNLVSKLVVVNNRRAIVELNDIGKGQIQHTYYFNIGSIESFERNLKSVQESYNIPEQVRVPVVYVSEGNTTKVIVNFLPTLLFLGAIFYMSKKAGVGGMGGPLGFGKSTAKKFNQESNVKIRFKDVAGMAEAKEEVMEFVKFLQNPDKYEKLGANIPRGAILSGPPGTGKTLLAKATAGEAQVPFYSVSGSEFVEMFVGVGASRVRDLFKTARENAPSIVFVDEIDAIGKQRSKGNASGANDERETTLNQLLVEMDGFESSDHVIVLAGTNRADILDKALMRPGRFDRHVAIDNPELQGRKEIFEVHLKKITLAKDIDSDLSGRLAALTPGFSGADIANVCNEAALIAARYNSDAVSLKHFELAIERVIGGIEKKTKLLNPEEQKIVAYHEAGHAVCGWYLKHAHPLLKVSIIPRGQGALGYAQYLPPDQYLMSAAQLRDRMIMTLGGRVSEELHFSSVTGGAHDDFKKVTNIAQSMVLRFGMSKKVGMVNYADTQSSDNLTKPFSDETNQTIDGEINRIVKECYDACTELLKSRAKEVELVAQELLKKEFITREDMIRLLGKRPFPENNDAFDKYLDGKAAFKRDDN